MTAFEQVPDQIILSGEGLRRMTPEQFGAFVGFLGTTMDMEVTPVLPDGSALVPHSQEPGVPEDTASREEFLTFAVASGYSENMAKRAWGGSDAIQGSRFSTHSIYMGPRTASTARFFTKTSIGVKY